MSNFSFTRFFLYPLFFLYPFVALQFVYKNINIPASDILAMLLGISFFLTVMGEFSLKARLPELNIKGITIYGLFLISALLSIGNASSFGASLKYFFRHPFFYSFVYFVAIGSILIWHGRTRLNLFYDLLCALSLLTSVISISTSLLRLFTSGIWGASDIPFLANNHKVLAVTLAINLPFLIAMATHREKHTRLIYYITIALSAAAVILSFSKTSWLAMVVISGLFSLKVFRRLDILKPLVIMVIILLLALAGYYLFEMFAASEDVTRAESSRYFLAWLALKMFLNHPILGSGIGSFIIELKEYTEVLSSAGFPGLSELDAHGLVFKLLSETGVAGFIFYVSFYITVFFGVYKIYMEQKRAANRLNERLLYGCLVALVSLFLLNSFFGTDTHAPRLWFPLAFISSHIYIMRNRPAGVSAAKKL